MVIDHEKLPNESCRECVIRISSKYGVLPETIDLFDRAVDDGLPEYYAAVNALCDSINMTSCC